VATSAHAAGVRSNSSAKSRDPAWAWVRTASHASRSASAASVSARAAVAGCPQHPPSHAPTPSSITGRTNPGLRRVWPLWLTAECMCIPVCAAVGVGVWVWMTEAAGDKHVRRSAAPPAPPSRPRGWHAAAQTPPRPPEALVPPAPLLCQHIHPHPHVRLDACIGIYACLSVGGCALCARVCMHMCICVGAYVYVHVCVRVCQQVSVCVRVCALDVWRRTGVPRGRGRGSAQSPGAGSGLPWWVPWCSAPAAPPSPLQKNAHNQASVRHSVCV
jgi:hypothetical protein